MVSLTFPNACSSFLTQCRFFVVVCGRFRQTFAFILKTIWPLVVLDRWLSCAIETIWEFSWTDLKLVVFKMWSFKETWLYAENKKSLFSELCSLVKKILFCSDYGIIPKLLALEFQTISCVFILHIISNTLLCAL